MTLAIDIRDLHKEFHIHAHGVRFSVFNGFDLAVAPGECVVLSGASGAGKSSLLRCIYGTYMPQRGTVLVRHDGQLIDIPSAHHRTLLDIRRRTIGYVSQFLRVVPRVSALDVVAEPLRRIGVQAEDARRRAGQLLGRLAIPERLWALAPQTFSGGEQQRVNIARGFAVDYPIILLDEPSSALDPDGRHRVAQLIGEARQRGAAIIGAFQDIEFGAAVGTRHLRITAAAAAA